MVLNEEHHQNTLNLVIKTNNTNEWGGYDSRQTALRSRLILVTGHPGTQYCSSN